MTDPFAAMMGSKKKGGVTTFASAYGAMNDLMSDL